MGPLNGLRIVEMDAIGPVPLAATILADMGADIIRIARKSGQAAYEDLGESILHRGRAGLVLDLKSDTDRTTALDLISKADALIEGFRPGVMERLGLGPETCITRNPRLVYGRMTGWGQSGPMAMRAGHDINYIAMAGALGLMGSPGRPPEPPLNLVGDYGGGAMFLALGVTAAMLSAQRGGAGQVVDVAMTDGTAMLLSLFIALRQGGSWTGQRADNLLDGGRPFYRCYACADGGHVAVGALEPQFFAALLQGLGIDPATVDQYDPEGWPRMQDQFAALFASRSRDDWTVVFEGTDACVTPVLSLNEAFTAAQNSARETFVTVDGMRHPAPAPRFSGTPSEIRASTTVTSSEALRRWSAT